MCKERRNRYILGEGKEKILEVINSLLQESEQYTYASLPKGEYGYPTHVPASFIVWAKRVDNIIKQYTESSSAPYVLVETYSGQIHNIEGNGQDKFNPIKEALVTALQEAKKMLEKDFFEELKNNSSDINQVRSPLLESICNAYAAVEKTAESHLNIDNLSETEMGFADSVVIDYLTERFGEQDDALGNWPRDWHECPEAFELWEKTIQELRVSEAMESLDQLKGVAETKQEIKNSGDTYNINAEHVSLGGKAQHAVRDINTTTPEPKKEKGKGKLTIILSIIAVVVAILIFFFGDNIWGRFNRKPKNNELAVGQIETPKIETETIKEAEIGETRMNKGKEILLSAIASLPYASGAVRQYDVVEWNKQLTAIDSKLKDFYLRIEELSGESQKTAIIDAIGQIKLLAGTGSIEIKGEGTLLEALDKITVNSQQGFILIDGAKITAPQIRLSSEIGGVTNLTDTVSETKKTKIDIGKEAQIKIEGNARIDQN